jgi:hypothetical protein
MVLEIALAAGLSRSRLWALPVKNLPPLLKPYREISSPL